MSVGTAEAQLLHCRAACLQLQASRVDSDEATTAASTRGCVCCLKTSSEAVGLVPNQSPSPPSSTSSPASGWQTVRTRPPSWVQLHAARGCPRDQPRSPARRPRGPPDRGLRPNHGVITAKIRGPPRLPAWGTTRHVLAPASVARARAPAPAPRDPSSLGKGTSLLAPGCCTRPPQRGQRRNGRGRPGGVEWSGAEEDRSLIPLWRSPSASPSQSRVSSCFFFFTRRGPVCPIFPVSD